MNTIPKNRMHFGLDEEKAADNLNNLISKNIKNKLNKAFVNLTKNKIHVYLAIADIYDFINEENKENRKNNLNDIDDKDIRYFLYKHCNLESIGEAAKYESCGKVVHELRYYLDNDSKIIKYYNTVNIRNGKSFGIFELFSKIREQNIFTNKKCCTYIGSEGCSILIDGFNSNRLINIKSTSIKISTLKNLIRNTNKSLKDYDFGETLYFYEKSFETSFNENTKMDIDDKINLIGSLRKLLSNYYKDLE